jgi:hypothetical protein
LDERGHVRNIGVATDANGHVTDAQLDRIGFGTLSRRLHHHWEETGLYLRQCPELPPPPRQRARLHAVPARHVRNSLAAINLVAQLSPERSTAPHVASVPRSEVSVEASVPVRLRRDSTFGAIASAWFEFVVLRNRRFCRARRPF